MGRQSYSCSFGHPILDLSRREVSATAVRWAGICVNAPAGPRLCTRSLWAEEPALYNYLTDCAANRGGRPKWPSDAQLGWRGNNLKEFKCRGAGASSGNGPPHGIRENGYAHARTCQDRCDQSHMHRAYIKRLPPIDSSITFPTTPNG